MTSEREFIAIDGEAIADNYCLLGSSKPKILCDRNGAALSTEQCLNYLLDLRTHYRTAIFVWFAAHYDVNMIMRDLSPKTKDVLFRTGAPVLYKTKTNNWKIEYLHRKTFKVSSLNHRRRIVIYDTFAFFMCAAAEAYRRWLGDLDLSVIEKGKASRSDFTIDELDFIIGYNRAECLLLVEVMNRIRKHAREVDLEPKKWYGPSALACELLRRERIAYNYPRWKIFRRKVHKNITKAFEYAYFGGRVEAFQLGSFKNVLQLDINSAYPASMKSLPKISVLWLKADTFQPHTFSVWRVKWKNCSPIGPFPFRSKGRIFFPANGEGYYWEPEVRAALAVYGPARVQIKYGYVNGGNEKANIGRVMENVYNHRQEFKRQKNPAEMVLKLAINSSYGKLAQHRGTGAYHCLPWAGYITSDTRAQTFLVAANQFPKVIGIATDGILVRDGFDTTSLTIGKGLGDWSVEKYEKATVLMSGVYWLRNPPNEKCKEKLKCSGCKNCQKSGTRGFDKIDWQDTLRQLNQKGEAQIEHKIFVTHTLARVMYKKYAEKYLTFAPFVRTIRTKDLDKREYQLSKIRDWRKDNCGSKIRREVGKMSGHREIVPDWEIWKEIYFDEETEA